MKLFARNRRVDLPAVREVEPAEKGWLLYIWMQDGRSGMLDLSNWRGYPAAKWEEEGFKNWKMDAGMACWGEDYHICPDMCSEELVEMTYRQWHSMLAAVS